MIKGLEIRIGKFRIDIWIGIYWILKGYCWMVQMMLNIIWAWGKHFFVSKFLLWFFTFFLTFPTCSTQLILISLYDTSYMPFPYVSLLLPHFSSMLLPHAFPHICLMLPYIYTSRLWPCTLVYSLLSNLLFSKLTLKPLSKSLR